MNTTSQALLLTTTTQELPVQATTGIEATGSIVQTINLEPINAQEAISTFETLTPSNFLNL